MSTISAGAFSPDQLKSLRDAVHGAGRDGAVNGVGRESRVLPSTSLFKTATAEPDQDVLVMAPAGDSLFKSEPIDVTDLLSARGLSVEDDFDAMGATARLSASDIGRLKGEGYRVFDNSPRSLWEGLPKLSLASKPAGDYAMPIVDSTGWLKSDQLNRSGLTGAGQTVALLDSGFDHPAFALKAWKDVVDDSPTPVDLIGHGTHVAYDILQTAPDAGLVVVKVMDEHGNGRPSDIIKGLNWVVAEKLSGRLDIDVINMSLGGFPDGAPDSQNPINMAVEAATRAGITVVAAAGNFGPDRGTIGAPAESPYAIAVGSVLNPGQVSEFSSRGPTEDGLTKPDVLAPGEFLSGWSVPGSAMERTALAVERLRAMPAADLKQLLTDNAELRETLGLPDIITTLAPERVEALIKPNLPPTYIPAPGFVAAAGTSFSAPLVSGVLASLEQGRDLTPAQSMALLRGTASSLTGVGGNEQGAGLVDAARAFSQLQAVS